MEQGLTALLFFSRTCRLVMISSENRFTLFRIMPARTMENLIERSFALAAERTEDLTPLVYARLHREHPETLAMFRTQGSDLVKGSMLALTIEALLDLASDRSGKFRMIACEVSSHDAYGTPRELFFAFFGVIAATLRELLGAEWTAEMDNAWADMLAEIKPIVTASEL